MSINRLETIETEVLVAGGGLAGLCCALSAARNGKKVVLVQDRPVLGGNASSEVRMHIVGAGCHGGRGKALEVEPREGGIVEEIRLETAAVNPQRCASVHDLVLFDLCKKEPNLTLLLNTTVVGAEMDGPSIRKVRATRESTEESFEIGAKIFVDSTGDGRLGAEAGAEYRVGTEARSEFGESMAPENASPNTLGSSLLFTARRHPSPMPFRAPEWARKFSAEDFRKRQLVNLASPSYEYGYWWLEWGGHLDTIRDNEKIRDEVLGILLGVWDYVKNSGACPDAEFWALDWFSFLPGKRESRRFVGQYTLTQNDIEKSERFADAVAYGGWPIDLHPPRGIDEPGEPPCEQKWVDKIYDIPLRCAVSANIENLFFAGRNISATHVAFASTRVMATCAIIGEAVGVAAAVAIERSLPPSRLASEPGAVEEIQQRLLKQDCYLIGHTNGDLEDLARRAKVSASSHLPDASPENVLSGQTRSVHGESGAPAGRCLPGLHRWMSDPASGFPASLVLGWEEPVSLSEVRLVFDTGMHREMVFTLSDSCHRRNVWGPQPETVKDYFVEVLDASGNWKRVASIAGNYARMRVHRFPAEDRISALRVTVEATNGTPEARIFEVRAYR